MIEERAWFFFFFQAEDGIRDVAVTGVQTCALPILSSCPFQSRQVAGLFHHTNQRRVAAGIRSEERRVGKECRCRGAPDEEKKKCARSEAGEDNNNGGMAKCAYLETQRGVLINDVCY